MKSWFLDTPTKSEYDQDGGFLIIIYNNPTK